MRIAFMGKGGSGKTTLASLFILYLEKNYKHKVLAIDADLNVHLANQLKMNEKKRKHISGPKAQTDIKKYLIGNNTKIKSEGHFKKTTPPAIGSNIISLDDKNNYLYSNFCINRNNLYITAVGTYSEEKIGKSCYHDNLAIFENILTHSINKKTIVVADMVAGIDAFANTLHAQFDLLVFVVEPTFKSLEVYKQYIHLAKKAQVINNIVVIGNKTKDKTDIEFIRNNIDPQYLLGFITESKHIRNVDQQLTELTISEFEPNNIEVLEKIFIKLKSIEINANNRLNIIHKMHLEYVNQGYVIERFGDLSDQIDTNFRYE